MTAYPELLPASSPRDTSSPRDNAERHRPLRRSAPLPANDAAGLLAGAKFKGGSNPAKGRGNPPPEKKEATFVSGRRLVPHETMEDHRALLTHGIVVQPYQDEVTRRTMRHVKDAAKSHFVHSSLELAPAASAERKPMKGVGASHPNERLESTSRVFCAGQGDGGAARPHSALPCWAVTMTQARAAARPVERPRTAPPTASRVHYQACAAGHADVFQYRHSGGICPKEYKLEGRRVASPAVCSADATTTPGSAFWDSRQAYSYNRVRSNLSFMG